MCPWQNRRRCSRKVRDRVAVRQDKGSTRLRIPGREEGTIAGPRAIACATSLTTSRAQIPANDKLRNLRVPTSRFAARERAKRNAPNIQQRIRLAETTMVQHAAPSGRAGERSNKTGSAWRNTTTPRLDT